MLHSFEVQHECDFCSVCETLFILLLRFVSRYNMQYGPNSNNEFLKLPKQFSPDARAFTLYFLTSFNKIRRIRKSTRKKKLYCLTLETNMNRKNNWDFFADYMTNSPFCAFKFERCLVQTTLELMQIITETTYLLYLSPNQKLNQADKRHFLMN